MSITKLRPSVLFSAKRTPVFAVVIGFLAIAAIGCSGPPSPKGWAAAAPIVLEDQDVVLVPNKGRVSALAPEGVKGDFSQWSFPPRERDLYPVSEISADEIKDAIDATDIEGTAKEELSVRVDDLRVSGPTKDALKDEIDNSQMTSEEKDDIKALIDEVTDFESGAVRNLRAIYGDIGVSEDGEIAYIAAFRGIVYALNTRTGTSVWMRDTGDELVSGVEVDGDTIYFGTKDDRLIAASADDGELVWSVTLKGEVWSTPYISGEDLYATSLDGTVYKLDKATGDEQWRFEGSQSGIAGRIGKDGDTVYVGAFDNRLYAINDDDGSSKWTFEADNWFWATPLIQDGVVFAASLDGKVYAVNASDGTPAWDQGFDTGAPIRSSPVLAEDGLAVVSRDAQLYLLDVDSGQPVEGTPVTVGENATVEADLALGEGDLLYVVPRNPSLWIFEVADGLRSRGEFPLP